MKVSQRFVPIIFQMRCRHVWIANVLMPAGRNPLFGSKIFAFNRTKTNTANSFSIKNQRCIIAIGLRSLRRFAEVSNIQKWPIGQFNISMEFESVSTIIFRFN